MRRRLWILAATIAVVPVPAFGWHNHLTKSVPAADSAVAAPKEIRLWFAEQVNPKFSSISLLKADSSKVEIGKVAATDDPKSLAAPVTSTLSAGGYIVVWRTAGDDGHAVRGRYAFTVK